MSLGRGLPPWAMEVLHDPQDQELARLNREGDALETAIYFADKLLQRGLEPTRELVRAALAIVEPDEEKVFAIEGMAWSAIQNLSVYNPTDAGNARRFAAQH